MKTSVLIGLILAIFVAYDAHKRKMSPYYVFLLGMFAFFIPYIVVPLYFLMRGRVHIIGGGGNINRSSRFKSQTILCPKCGTDNPGDATECSQCHNKLRLN